MLLSKATSKLGLTFKIQYIHCITCEHMQDVLGYTCTHTYRCIHIYNVLILHYMYSPSGFSAWNQFEPYRQCHVARSLALWTASY